MVGVKIPRVGVKITRGILTPGGQAAQGVKDKLLHRLLFQIYDRELPSWFMDNQFLSEVRLSVTNRKCV